MTKEPLKVVTIDGLVLFSTRFIPAKANGKVVLINSATGVKQRFYYDFASFLCREGFIVYTYDYRGIGGSRPESMRGFKASMKDWGTLDYPSMLKNIYQSHPQSRVVVIGHSIGGQLAGFSRLTSKVEQVIMIGSQTPFWKNYDGFFGRSKLLFFWKVLIPLLTTVAGYFPASALGLFEDLPKGVAFQWARWARSSNYVFDEMPELRELFASLQQPALMISFSDDRLAPEKAVTDLMRYYPSLKWQHWRIRPEDIMQNGIGHFGFFRKKMKSALWAELADRITNPLAAPASQAA